MTPRHDWNSEEVLGLLNSPLDSLLSHARETHLRHADQDVQKCELLSVKTGACPEDCGYCAQSAHYDTGLEKESLLSPISVFEAAKAAKERGANRFCIGAAWRDIPTDQRFDFVLDMIRKVASLKMEVCCTMGMATETQLIAMKDAGLTAYNHNLDTSREHYDKVITTRTYDDRLETLAAVRKAGVQICCGAILGMGESATDRASLIAELGSMDPHPESVPINLLVPIEGTPLEGSPAVAFEDFLRTIATTRIVMPKARVRLSAGRNELTQEEQLACFQAGANSIFIGEKLLTTDNVELEIDEALVNRWEENQSTTTTSP